MWNENQGEGYGHVAIAYQNISISSFDSFDQNWNGIRTGQVVTHNSYTDILGYLRLKSTPPTPVDFIKSKFKWVLYANKIRRRNNNAGKRF